MHYKKLIFTLFGIMASFMASAGVIVLEGHYHKRNIYVQNSPTYAGVGFCTYQVKINGSITTDEINGTSFEIDLSQFNMEIGTPVTVIINYKDDGCMPKVLNPDALQANPTFETTYIKVSEKGLLKWTTVNETAKLVYIIEQFKWNKWVKVGEVTGNGTPGFNFYSFQTTPTAGLNKFRVKQRGYIDKTRYSEAVSYISMQPEVTYVQNKKSNTIDFSKETSFEMYDRFGNLVKKGHGISLSIHNLKNEVYYLNYGNTMVPFKKKL